MIDFIYYLIMDSLFIELASSGLFLLGVLLIWILMRKAKPKQTSILLDRPTRERPLKDCTLKCPLPQGEPPTRIKE